MDTQQKIRCGPFYTPVGKAKEYADWALEIYKNCYHSCLYCYNTQKVSPGQKAEQDFNCHGFPIENIVSKVAKFAPKLKSMMKSHEKVMMSFGSDAYQEKEAEYKVTRPILEILVAHNIKFDVLTKNPELALRDKDIFISSKGNGCLASTILFCKDHHRVKWEPNAPNIKSRVGAIQDAHRAGIKTWVSVEPVIEPDEALTLIKTIDSVVDLWKVGKLNYRPEAANVDWHKFANDVYMLLQGLGTDYVIKDSLKKYLKKGSVAIKKDGLTYII